MTFVDLDRRGNDFLADGPGGNGNDPHRLPRGIHKLGDVYFRIGEKMIHIQGGTRLDLPRSVTGIPVQARADRVHFLHVTQGGKAPGTLIGAYVLRYADGTSEHIPLVYGRNIANWWSFPRKDNPTEAEAAWTGSTMADYNPRLKEVRLFAITWTNPHPEREITALDVLVRQRPRPVPGGGDTVTPVSRSIQVAMVVGVAGTLGLPREQTTTG